METELKFQVPAARRDALVRALSTATAQRTRLRAVYADTVDDTLAAAGLALRLRKEGRHWVQTLKGRGDGLMQRLEHEVRLPPQRGEPALDPARHDGTPAGQALAAALAPALAAALATGRAAVAPADSGGEGAAGSTPGGQGTPGTLDTLGTHGGEAVTGPVVLQPLYRTDILRLHRVVRHAGARVEIAFDEGWIEAAGERLPVCEVEFELLTGPPAALVDLALRWVRRHGLWWDVRTKSERGHRLARGRLRVPATRAGKLRLWSGATPGEAWLAVLQATLAQALPNVAELAAPGLGTGAPAGGTGAAAEHVHQLRVALRRLRTALALLAPWSPDAEAAHALQAAWREPFARLGATRDADVLAGGLWPELQAAGAPPLALAPAGHADAAGDVVRDPAFTELLLRTLLLTLPAPPRMDELAPAAEPPALHGAAAAVLRRAWKRVRGDLDGFAALPVPLQHRLRRRLKRLRYGAEFVQSLWPGAVQRRWFQALGVVLDRLGRYNDLCVAQDQFRSRTATEAGAWFAVGWLAAQREVTLQQAAQALAALAALPRPWGKAALKAQRSAARKAAGKAARAARGKA